MLLNSLLLELTFHTQGSRDNTVPSFYNMEAVTFVPFELGIDMDISSKATKRALYSHNTNWLNSEVLSQKISRSQFYDANCAWTSPN